MKTFDLTKHMIFEGVAGSRLYGTHTPESDFDTRGVCLPPKEALLNPFQRFDVADSFDGEDKVVYALHKFFSLCADNNPNVLELLWVPPDKTLYSTPAWQKIVENRHLFLSKNVKHRFLGYAYSQMKALDRHRQWFLNPPTRKPTREEFGLGQTPLVSEGNLEAVLSVSQSLLKDEVADELSRERAYRLAKKKWDEYRQWQENRNPARKHSEEKNGYDGKYASHLFRLLLEGKSLLLTGELTFPLPDADWLLSVKNGLYSYNKLVEILGDWNKHFNVWYDASPLPDKPNRNKLEKLYWELMTEHGMDSI